MEDSPVDMTLQERGCRWLGEIFGYWKQGGLDVGRFLAACPPDGVELPTLPMADQSWHHLANQLTDRVVVTAIHAAYHVDEANQFSVPSDWAEVVGRARGNPQRYWPAIAKALNQQFKLTEHEENKLCAFLEAEWTRMAAAGNGQTAVHSLIRDGCRHAIYLLFAAHGWQQRVQAPTPPAPPPLQADSKSWPPDDGWHFRPGLYAFRHKTYRLHGKLWKLLKHLAESRFPSTAAEMVAAMGSDGAKADGSIRTDLTNLRTILRRNHKLPSGSDPIPCKAKGEPSTWELDLEYRPPRKSK